MRCFRCFGPPALVPEPKFDQNSIEFRSECTASIKMHKIARICSKLDQICSKLLEIRSNLLKICAHLLEIRPNFLEIRSTCTNLYETSKSACRALTSSLFEGARFSKFDEKLLRQGFTTEPHARNSRLSFPDATWRRFWSPRRASGRSRPPFLASRGAL